MPPENIKTVSRRIWNQNCTKLVSTKLVTKNHIYIHVLSSNGQMITRLYQRIAVSLLRKLIFRKSIFVYKNLIDSLDDTNNWWPQNVSILCFHIAFVTHMVLCWAIYFTQHLFSNADIMEKDGSSHPKHETFD